MAMITDNARAVLRVTGKDRLSWLNGLVTCELKSATPGQAIYGLFVSRVGKIQADAWFLIATEHIDVAVPRTVAAEMHAMLDGHLIMEDAAIALDLEQMLAFGAQTSEPSYALERGALTVRLATVPFVEPTPESALAWLAFRLEHGIAEFGADFDRALLPHEASLERDAVSFQKGCYLCQEVVCMVELRGQVNRRLVLLEADAPLRTGAEVKTVAGDAVGTLRSVGSHEGAFRGFALLKRVAAENEKEFAIGEQIARKAVLPRPSVQTKL
jgi:tRNA-modifying protein YgfZ